jgi:glycosyltransferase involved in cell wall biosynthesis
VSAPSLKKGITPVSVLILTLNEEINIAECIESVAWSNDIVVLDSFSTDDTVRVAEEKGARIIQRVFDDWSTHQNWALQSIDFKNAWVFYIDADERCPGELAIEILQRIGSTSNEVAFRLRRKDFFMGKWLKHAQLYPTWLVRLFQPSRIRFQRIVNPVPVVEEQIGTLSSHLNHYPFSQGISHWIARHNRYSDMEAIEAMREREEAASRLTSILSRDPNMRREALKTIFYQLPIRPAIKFGYYYLVRMGFLDGRPGLTYSILQAIYEYMIVIKTREARLRQKDAWRHLDESQSGKIEKR